ncbi:MAG: AbrB/MazE/SpoVT family DNA-binding domain-containing protein [Gammaproteobacteria bacterium]|nr:AbrB/MazE/SpoVT family DNA-binding domain-containing protein [Gammaproteobacteria bacterium]
MSTLTITAKGQVTLKQDLLNHLGVGPGQKIEIDKLPDGRIEVKAAGQKGMISGFIGCLSQKKKAALTLAEIDEIAARGWAGEKVAKK